MAVLEHVCEMAMPRDFNLHEMTVRHSLTALIWLPALRLICLANKPVITDTLFHVESVHRLAKPCYIYL